MDSIWERDSISRGSASARENNDSHEKEALCPKCDLYLALLQGLNPHRRPTRQGLSGFFWKKPRVNILSCFAGYLLSQIFNSAVEVIKLAKHVNKHSCVQKKLTFMNTNLNFISFSHLDFFPTIIKMKNHYWPIGHSVPLPASRQRR